MESKKEATNDQNTLKNADKAKGAMDNEEPTTSQDPSYTGEPKTKQAKHVRTIAEGEVEEETAWNAEDDLEAARIWRKELPSIRKAALSRSSLSEHHLASRLRNISFGPYQHRKILHGTNYFESVCNMMAVTVGMGLLMMPQSFLYAGMVGGIIGCFVLTFFCIYGMHMMFKCFFIICKRKKIPAVHYSEAMKIAFQQGPNGFQRVANYCPCVVAFFDLFNEIGMCSVYVLVVAVNIKSIVDVYTESYSITYYIGGLLLPFILINLSPNMKVLAKLSIINLIVAVICIGIILYYMLSHLPDIKQRRAFGRLEDLPFFIGTFLCFLEAPGVIIVIEAEVKHPDKFTKWYGALNMSLIVVLFLYILMGILGYWKYGEDMTTAVIFQLPDADMLAICCKGMFALVIFISFPITCYVPIRIVWDEVLYERIKHRKNLYCWELMVRVILVFMAAGVAAAVPFLEDIATLIGTVSLSTLGLIFPSLMDICLRHPDNYGVYSFHMGKDVVICMIGVAIFGFGIHFTVWSIILEYYSQHHNIRDIVTLPLL